MPRPPRDRGRQRRGPPITGLCTSAAPFPATWYGWRRVAMVSSADMTHVFIAPHPDDVALSCGGLVASLREVGQNVTIITVYSGAGAGSGSGAGAGAGSGSGAGAGAGSGSGAGAGAGAGSGAGAGAGAGSGSAAGAGPGAGAGAGAGAGSGSNGTAPLSEYQRTALGFGNKALAPDTVAFRRDNVPADMSVPVMAGGAPAWAADPGRLAATQDLANLQARQFWQRAAWTRNANITAQETEARPLPDSIPGQGSLEDVDLSAADIAAVRRIEDERYAYMMECSVVWLDLPDAVYRGYEGDDQLLGAVRDDDQAPYEALRREILRLEPQMVYAPLGVGNHVDHQLCREAVLAMLDEERGWVMPGPGLAGRLSFYEDFPYAWWHDFRSPADLPGGLGLPPGIGLEARFTDITEQLDRKAAGIGLYGSQVGRLFESEQGMLDALAGHGARIAREGGIRGFAERYWAAVTL
jgi:LmbE family N-acetylglucosaminyl deacetylase